MQALQGTFQARAGYFHFANSWAKKIYGNGAPDIEIEGSIKVHPYISMWSNLNYVWKNGYSTEFSNCTHLDLGTLSLGANFVASQASRSLYFGLGISGAYAHTKDHTSYLPANTSHLGIGCVVKFGAFFSCPKQLFLNPFFDYYYQPIHARNSAIHDSINLGGFRIGLGIGYHFMENCFTPKKPDTTPRKSCKK